MNGWKRIASFRWRERRLSGISMGASMPGVETMLHESDVRNFPCVRDKSPAAELTFYGGGESIFREEGCLDLREWRELAETLNRLKN